MTNGLAAVGPRGGPMGDEPVAPHAPGQVAVGERGTRFRAAAVAARAYWTHWIGLGLSLVVASLVFIGATLPLLQETSSTVGLAVVGTMPIIGFALMAGTWGLICGATVYFAPRLKDHELWFVDTGRARATLTTAPDRRRDALECDVKASMFAAWEQDRGAGTVLGKYVRDELEGRGSRITLAATPKMARRYEAEGFVQDGPQLPLLPVRRMASRPRPQAEPDFDEKQTSEEES